MVIRRNLYLIIGVPIVIILSIIAIGLVNRVWAENGKTAEQAEDQATVVELVWENGALQHEEIEDFQLFAEQATRPIFVDFWAAWCAPCRTAAPFVDSLAATFDQQVHIVKIDVDHEQELARLYRVQSIPLFIMINNGEQVDQIVGYSPEMNNALTDMITRQIR